MNFDLTDEQQMLQGAAREFLASRLKSEQLREASASDDAFDESLWNEMSELNWPGLLVSEDHGGQGLGTVDLAVLFEQLGYALAPGPIFSTTLAALELEAGATEEQRERYLAPLAVGEQRGTLALWDRGAGWTPDDARSLEQVNEKWQPIIRSRNGYLENISDADLPGELGYTRFTGEVYSLPLVQQMQHVVNHATLHRGQVVGMIRQLGIAPPTTDLLFYLMETRKPSS